jgi:serine/threonine-protein kinase
MSLDGLMFDAYGVTANDIMLLTPGPDRRVQPLVHGAAVQRNAAISADGRWLAYESDVTGRLEIYVVPFPNVNGSLTQASTEGGTRPLWARSGPELFFVAPSGALMTVSIERGGARPKAGLPSKLFDWPSPPLGVTGRSYDVALDGRFLMTKPVEESNQTTAPKSLVVVQHFDEELKRRVPTN